MAYSLTIGGYEFDNPPEKYRKHLTLGNTPVPHYQKGLAQFYQSGQQELQFEVEGQLSLNEQNDLQELEDLQEIAIQGGEVHVDFDPFFSGDCIIEDDPFRQADELGYYRFILTVNRVYTNDTAYPPHATPTTGNTFKLGGFDFGYDPESVEENYERQTNTVDRLQGISQSVDNAGLVTKVTIDGNTDGAGQTALWDKARSNELSYLDAEFQNGWALIADLSVRNNENAPDYLKGLFQYSLDLLIVSDPEGGIGEVSSFIDHGVKDTGTYVSDDDAGSKDTSGLNVTISAGTGSLNDKYVSFPDTTVTLSANDTNYVFVTDTDADGEGTVKVNQSGFPADCIPLWEFVTDDDSITDSTDHRDKLIGEKDTSDSDLVFSDDFVIDDTAFEFARIMALADAVDIDDGYTSSVPTRDWGAASDWDNAVAETRVKHPSDIIQLDPFSDGFEDGDVAEWTVNSFQAVQDRTFNGSWAGYTDNGLTDAYQAARTPPGFSGGAEPAVFQFYWQETSNSTGGGIRLVNSDGNVEIGVGTDNPEWQIDDAASFRQIYNADGYNRWVRFTLIFDWAAEAYSYDFEDLQSGSTATGSGDLKHGKDVEQIWIENQNAEQWRDASMEMWFEDITLTLPGSLTTASRTYNEPVSPNLTNLTYSLNGGSITLDVVGSPGTSDEERYKVPLDGATEYGLSWSQGHTDFRIAPELKAGSPDFPTFSAGSLTLSDAGGSLNWKGFAALQDSIADIDDTDLLPAFGQASLTESVSVNDGGTASKGGGTEETSEWGTAADWNNSQSQSGVEHEPERDETSVRLGQQNTQENPMVFSRFYAGSGSTVYDVSGNGNDGTKESNLSWETAPGPRFAESISNDGTTGSTVNYGSIFNTGNSYIEAEVWFYLTDDSTNQKVFEQNGMWTCFVNRNQNGVFNFATFGNNADMGPPLSTGQYHHIYMRWEVNNQYVAWINGSKYTASVSDGHDTGSDPFGLFDDPKGDVPFKGKITEFRAWQGDSIAVTDPANQLLYVTDGDLTTDWKSFSSDRDPSSLSLKNTVAQPNGETITVSVQSDVNGDGTVDETSDPITLDGSGGPYNVTGLSQSSARFALDIRMSTGDATTSPLFNSADLVAGGGGGDSDQNINTGWLIFGGKYDRSGNEYEGGGVTTKYGQ
jgi:hypothetical protein